MTPPTALIPRPLARLWPLLIAACAGAALAACGTANTPTEVSPGLSSSTATPTGTAPASQTTVGTAQTSIGAVLVGPDGHTLYIRVSDVGRPAPCVGECLSTWPPLKATAGPVRPGSGVTTTLQSGSLGQVTANGFPLYYYAGDTQAGQNNGEGIAGGGATWYAVSPSGNPIPPGGASGGSPTPSYGGY